MPRVRVLLLALTLALPAAGCAGADPALEFTASAEVPGFPLTLRTADAGGLELTVDAGTERRRLAVAGEGSRLVTTRVTEAPRVPGPPLEAPNPRGARFALAILEHGVAADGSGALLRSVKRGPDIRLVAQAFTADGTLGTEQPLDPVGAQVARPRLAVAPDGSALAVWEQQEGETRHFAYATRRPGRRFSPARTLPERPSGELVNIAAGGGSGLLAYEAAGGRWFARIVRDGRAGKRVAIPAPERRQRLVTAVAPDGTAALGVVTAEPSLRTATESDAPLVQRVLSGTVAAPEAATLPAPRVLERAADQERTPAALQAASGPGGAVSLAWERGSEIALYAGAALRREMVALGGRDEFSLTLGPKGASLLLRDGAETGRTVVHAALRPASGDGFTSASSGPLGPETAAIVFPTATTFTAVGAAAAYVLADDGSHRALVVGVRPAG